ncbi:hypothetical protein ACGFZQ_37070 [Streptomyces sp. NPDC048254]|uniref:hypothetical protein n=1 Tax=Streptomyces sp. NPDC048254 TaxID=3365525 RepID=UPI0037184216
MVAAVATQVLHPFGLRRLLRTFADRTSGSRGRRGVADHTEAIRTELAKVVERVDDYLNTALPPQTPALKVSFQDHEAQLVQAMKQEAARAELAQAISTARQKITLLRRG